MAEEYIVTVKPKGVPLDEATDTREFTFTPDDLDALEAEAKAHIRENELIDPTTFLNHWEIAVIEPAGAADVDDVQTVLDNLKDRLCQQTSSDVTSLRAQVTHPSCYTMYVKQNNQFTSVALVLDDSLYQTFDDWLARLNRNQTIIQQVPLRLVDEAMVHTVADKVDDGTLNSALIDDFNIVQATHDIFIETVMQNESEFLSNVKDLAP